MRYYKPDDDDSEEAVQVFYEGRTEQDRYLEMVQAGMSAHEINQSTLSIALEILQKSFFWKFRTPKSKMVLIEEMYRQLTELI